MDKDPYVCDNIKNIETKFDCITKVAINRNDKSICVNMMPYEEFRHCGLDPERYDRCDSTICEYYVEECTKPEQETSVEYKCNSIMN